MNRKIQEKLGNPPMPWFHLLIAAYVNDEIKPDSPVFNLIISEVLRQETADKLLVLFFKIFYDGRMWNFIETCKITVLLLGFFARNARLSLAALKKTEAAPFLAYQLYHWYKCGYLLCLSNSREDNRFEVNKTQSELTFFWNVEDGFQQASTLNQLAFGQVKSEEAALKKIHASPPEWCAIESVWDRLHEKGAKWGLHEDGDFVRFDVPHLIDMGFTGAMLKPAGAFPRAIAEVTWDITGIRLGETFILEHGHLKDADVFWSDPVHQHIAAAIVTGYWKIVRGQDDDAHRSHTKRGTNGGAIERRAARPHTFRLRPNFKARSEAAPLCAQKLGRELLAGQSFREPVHGSTVTSFRATATITERHIHSILYQNTAVQTA